MKSKFKSLVIDNPGELIFGKAPKPVTCGNDLTIGGGKVYPEINFTLPPMIINESNWKEVINHYNSIGDALVKRSVKLDLPGLVVEFEQLPPMTANPEWGAEITVILKKYLNELYNNHGIPNALRVTVVDLRDAKRPPMLRSGEEWEQTKKSFELCAQTGADILSIESVGGKEVHDEALVYGDLSGIVSSLGVLASNDMNWLWNEIVSIAEKNNIIAGGDSACGFANTAMQLAGQGMIPSILAAIDRAATVPRSLAAFEQGAVGPSKDCAYEGPFIKAITGYPISMEGKSACCAHFSPIGNISGYAADLWSNESVQNIKLLSGSAPEAFLELLGYDCRLFNESLKTSPYILKQWLIDSDVRLSPEALVLEPQNVIDISKSVVSSETYYDKTKAAVIKSCEIISKSFETGKIKLNDLEQTWLNKISDDIESMPSDEESALQYLDQTYGTLFNSQSYDIKLNIN